MKKVYVLQHSYELNNCDETKFIGVFSSLTEAKNAIEKLKKKEGFKQYQKNFYIDIYPINKIYWEEGFS